MSSSTSNPEILEKIFHLSEKKTSVHTELLAGMTTFISLAYILFVNPNILADAGIPKEAAVASTIFTASITTAMMGIVANYPVALAPSMGLNAFFTYYVVGTLHLPWQVALGAVFFSGVFFFLMTLGGIRQAIIKSVPANLKRAIGVGIGLFIAFIGMKGTGIIVPDKATYLTLGHITEPTTLLSICGLLLTGMLMVRGVKGAILIGIFAITLASMLLGLSPVPHSIADIMSLSLPSVSETFGAFDIRGAWEFGIFSIVFTFTVVELFDNIGTLIGLTTKAGMVKENGDIENIDKALTIDAIGTMMSAIFGTSTVGSYIESASGIAEGGRTGLTAVTVSALFIVSLIFAPLIGLVPVFATSPSLIIVGILMMGDLANINFKDFDEAMPAFLTILMMPLTSSIANGFAFGFVTYTIMKVVAGKSKEVNIIMWIVSIAFLVNIALRG
ncbi:MAG: NCS2 family permease [Schwartzia sp.]|nr:NCS2 family permease [Schwartzia sp. (in: firmicutes)]